MRFSVKIAFVVLAVLTLLLSACGARVKGQRGEIIGVTAQVSLDEASSGKIENMAYAGSLVLLLDGEEVTASCPKELLSDVRGCPTFNADQISGGFVASIVVSLKENQEALLVRNESDEWEVIEILE
jgi:hypothetical protein